MRAGEIEICLDGTTVAGARLDAMAARAGGAARVELCARMDLDGLTPSRAALAAVAQSFGRTGLMAMVRPRAGDFAFSAAEVETMLRQLDLLAEVGADGAVLGVLRADRTIDSAAMRPLLQAARQRGLSTTFHRAFDAAPDPLAALDQVLELGLDRVLTAGMPWGAEASVAERIERLATLIQRAGRRIELALAGGIGPETVDALLAALPLESARISLHAYSLVRTNGRTSAARVAALARRAAPHFPPSPAEHP